MKVCAEPGCPAIQREARCKAHRSQYERQRGTRRARGYDAAHVQMRAGYRRRMDAGETFVCWRCGGGIDARAWTLGHCDDDRSSYHGPECPPCDYATAGRTSCPHASHN